MTTYSLIFSFFEPEGYEFQMETKSKREIVDICAMEIHSIDLAIISL